MFLAEKDALSKGRKTPRRASGRAVLARCTERDDHGPGDTAPSTMDVRGSCLARQLAEGEAPNDYTGGALLRRRGRERAACTPDVSSRLRSLLAGAQRYLHACDRRDLSSDLTGGIRRCVEVDV